MYPFDSHERLRRELSAYADGELSPQDIAKVEAHLATCGDCRALLDGLRVASAALAGLPAAETPRSFMLTPHMVGERAQAPARRPAPAYNGLRFAAAGLAVALAVVMIADRSDFGGEGDSQDSSVQGLDERASTAQGATAESAIDLDGLPADTRSASEHADDAASPAAGGGVGGAANNVGSAQATSVPAAAVPAPEEDRTTGESTAPELAGGDADNEAADDTAAQPDEANDDNADQAQSDAIDEARDDGVATLTIVEGALAVLLAATLVGMASLWFAQRRRSA